jgi:hypothetical protein
MPHDPRPTNSPSSLQSTPKGHPRHTPITVSPWEIGGLAFCNKAHTKHLCEAPSCHKYGSDTDLPIYHTRKTEHHTSYVLLGSACKRTIRTSASFLAMSPPECRAEGTTLEAHDPLQLNLESDVLRLVCVPQTACPRCGISTATCALVLATL